MSIAVGIDLGTTNSGVAVLKNEEPEILKLGEEPFIPSCVAFDRNKVLVGKEAFNHENKKNMISGIKYIIGLDYEAAKNTAERQELSFDLTEVDGMPQIKVDYNGGKESFSPEEISAMILSELKTIALKRLKCENIKAVITVPTHFTSKRRAATKLAAEIAGIDVLQLIDESTAAAIAYEVLRPDPFGRRRRTLVFDLGGGTLDITIIKTRGKSIMVRASDGNLELGGENFTKNLIEETETEVYSRRALDNFTKRKITAEANKVKESLSFKYSESFSFEINGNPVTVSQARLTEVNKDEYGAAIRLVTDAMKRAGITKDKIHHVVLSGGSVRIPFIIQKLENIFGGNKVYCKITESDQLVVKGAAVLASLFSETNNTNYSTAIRGLDFSDVTPFPLGFCGSNGATIIVIPKNTKIPARETRFLNIDRRGITKILFQICEGEKIKFDENELLDSRNIPIAFTKDGKVSLAVTFELRNNCWLCVTIKQKHSVNDPVKFEINFETHLSDARKLENQQRRLKRIMLQSESEPTHAQDTDLGESENGQPQVEAQGWPVGEFDNDDDPRTCVAVYDWEARNEDEISMKKGDRFTVIKIEKENDWTEVSSNNMVGLVPTKYMQFERVEETRTASTSYWANV